MNHYAGGTWAKPPSLSELAALWSVRHANVRPGLTGEATLNLSPSPTGPVMTQAEARPAPAQG